MSSSIAKIKSIGWIWVLFCSISFLSGAIVLFVQAFWEQQLYVNNQQMMLVMSILQMVLMAFGVLGGLALIKYKEWGRKLVFYLSIIFLVIIISYELISYIGDVVFHSSGWQWIWHRTLAFLVVGIIPLSLCCFVLKEPLKSR